MLSLCKLLLHTEVGMIDRPTELRDVGGAAGKKGCLATIVIGRTESPRRQMRTAAFHQGGRQPIRQRLTATMGLKAGCRKQFQSLIQPATGQGGLATFDAKNQHGFISVNGLRPFKTSKMRLIFR